VNLLVSTFSADLLLLHKHWVHYIIPIESSCLLCTSLTFSYNNPTPLSHLGAPLFNGHGATRQTINSRLTLLPPTSDFLCFRVWTLTEQCVREKQDCVKKKQSENSNNRKGKERTCRAQIFCCLLIGSHKQNLAKQPYFL
jgi:hypothetical protein